MATEYTSIRVPVDVAARLHAFAEALTDNRTRRQLPIPDRGNTGVNEAPLWFAIQELLHRRERHIERRRLSERRRRNGSPVLTHGGRIDVLA